MSGEYPTFVIPDSEEERQPLEVFRQQISELKRKIGGKMDVDDNVGALRESEMELWNQYQELLQLFKTRLADGKALTQDELEALKQQVQEYDREIVEIRKSSIGMSEVVKFHAWLRNRIVPLSSAAYDVEFPTIPEFVQELNQEINNYLVTT